MYDWCCDGHAADDLVENQQRLRPVADAAFQLLGARQLRHLRELAVRQLEEPIHAIVDVGAIGRGGRLFSGEQLRDVRLRHVGGAREIALLEAQLQKSLPDHQCHVHGPFLVIN